VNTKFEVSLKKSMKIEILKRVESQKNILLTGLNEYDGSMPVDNSRAK